jgi:tetratricopeptide (TPR) repeat protein
MRTSLVGLIFTLLAVPAWSQTQQQSDWCYGATSTDDQTIAGCNAVIQSSQQSSANKAAAFTDRAFAEIDLGLFDQAITDASRAIALDPTAATAYHDRAAAYFHKGLYSQTVADDTRAIAHKSGYANAYYTRGTAYEKLGRRGPAADDYRAALKFNPGMTIAQNALNALGSAK